MYIHQLIDKFSNFLLLPVLAAFSNGEPSKQELLVGNSAQYYMIV
jgi:hypothetical protein